MYSIGGNCAQVYYPAAFNFPGLGLSAQVIAVSATDQADEFVDGYVYSPGTDPVNSPNSAFIDVAAPGKDITLLFSTGNGDTVPFTPTTVVADGTSFAAPLVVAEAALLFAVNPTLRVDEVYDLITRSAEKVDQTDHPDTYTYTDPATGETLGWNQYTGYGRVNAFLALKRTLETYGGRPQADLYIPEGETWNFEDVTVEFAPGARLLADGNVNADGTTFTEGDAGQGWGGVGIFFAGTLDFDGVTVTEAKIGVEVFSDNVLISDSDFLGNEVGIASGYVTRYCATPPNCPAAQALERSSFSLVDSRVAESVADPTGSANTGIGIAARNTDAEIIGGLGDTFIGYNDGFGLVVWNADVFPYQETRVVGNGNDGVRMTSNGDLQMTNFIGDPGNDCVVDNTDEEIELSADSYLFIGNNFRGGQNSIFDDDLDDDTYLIARGSSSGSVLPAIPAERTYWGTGGAPPPGAFNTAVDASNPLATDPNGCTFSNRLAGPSKLLSRAQGPGGEHPLTPLADEDPVEESEGWEWLRADIRAFRAALVQALADGSDAEGALRQLYRAQRLDRADALGEHAETMALVASTRTLLTEGESLSDELRGAAEAALLAEVADALRHGAYEDAEGLVAQHEELVEDVEQQRSLSLHAAMAAEAAGRVAEAYARVEAVRAALVAEGREDEAEGPALVAAALEAQLGPEAAPVLGPQVALGRAGGPARVALGAPYPNPSAGNVTVPLVLGAAAEARVVVFDVLGRRVATLADGLMEAGRYALTLEAAALPAGVYLVRLETQQGGVAQTQRLTVLR